jgi:hypothetical protein
MVRFLAAEIGRAIILGVPSYRSFVRQPQGDSRNGFAPSEGAHQTRFSAGETTYCLGGGRGLRSPLFLNIGE